MASTHLLTRFPKAYANLEEEYVEYLKMLAGLVDSSRT